MAAWRCTNGNARAELGADAVDAAWQEARRMALP
jgi:hypothetical protein